MVLEKAEDLTPKVLQDILQRSLGKSSIHVTHVQAPEGLGGVNDQYGSDLSKIIATVEEDGKPRKLHLVVKAALQSKAAWFNVILGTFIFYRETFWFDAALPELLKLVNAEQAAALTEFAPKVHYARCNYQQEDRQGCLLNNGVTCCCCILCLKSKEKGVILMENLKEGAEDTYVDLKEIERTSGGGVKTSHVRMILEALAHFHGAWMVWLKRGEEGIGDMTRDQMMKFFEPGKMYEWKWMWKSAMKKFMSYYTVCAETKDMQSTKERIQKFVNSPQSVDRFMKVFNYKDSKFKTMTHSDMWSSQIMFALNEDGTPKRVKILDYQALTLGHPAMDIWSIVYSCTDGEYRKDYLEEDLKAYYTILSGYMDAGADYTEFRQELEDRRAYSQIQFSICCFVTLSPTKLPNPMTEMSKFGKACKGILTAEEKEEDHPDLKEIRRRMMSNLKEMEVNLI